MKLKPILAIALVSAFAVTSLGAYAQQDEKKDEKNVISQSDEKKEEKNTYQSDEKEPKKPELILSDKNQQPYPIQSEFEMHS